MPIEETVLNREDTRKRFNELTNSAIVTIEFTSTLVGGQNAQDDGLEAFVIHQLGLKEENPEWTPGSRKVKQWLMTVEGKLAFSRIKKDEIGEIDTSPEDGELNDTKVYAVKVIRREDDRPYIGDWMVKANLKQSASRLGYFVKKKGSKGDLAEMGRVEPYGRSKRDSPHYIYLIPPEGRNFDKRVFETISGTVHNAKGRSSIMSECEIVPVGTQAEFLLRWPKNSKLTRNDIIDIICGGQNCGLGSARSLERGRFDVTSLKVYVEKTKLTVKDKKSKKEKDKVVA